jgi:catechol 2,3-dioxygenase-like lactoylglutathione lyase family enzyme
MAQIRHIAYRAEDVEAMTEFFVNGLGLTVSQRRPGGAVDLSDGSICVTILPAGINSAGGRSGTGIDHIGFTVENEGAVSERITAAGGKEANAVNLGNAYYELKFVGPEGIIVDVGHWVGTAPVGTAEAVAEPAS